MFSSAGAPTKFTSILDKRRHESKAKAGGEGASTDGDGEQNGDDAAALTDKEHPFRCETEGNVFLLQGSTKINILTRPSGNLHFSSTC